MSWKVMRDESSNVQPSQYSLLVRVVSPGGGQLGLPNSSVVRRMHRAMDFPVIAFAVFVRARA
eukprot:2868399-Prymnesium_polylepis.1